MSPGTNSVTSTAIGSLSRITSDLWRMLVCSASMTRSDRYSVKKPRPTLMPTMAKMMIAFVCSPTTSEVKVAAPSRIRRGLRTCRTRMASARTSWVRMAFGPTTVRRWRASAADSPSTEEARRDSASGAASLAASRRVRLGKLLTSSATWLQGIKPDEKTGWEEDESVSRDMHLNQHRESHEVRVPPQVGRAQGLQSRKSHDLRMRVAAARAMDPRRWGAMSCGLHERKPPGRPGGLQRTPGQSSGHLRPPVSGGAVQPRPAIPPWRPWTRSSGSCAASRLASPADTSPSGG